MSDKPPIPTGLKVILDQLALLDDIPKEGTATPKTKYPKSVKEILEGSQLLRSYTVTVESRVDASGREFTTSFIKGTVPSLPMLVVVDLMEVVNALMDIKGEF